MDDRLPIEDALPELMESLERQGVVVLEAPPGAGKTTRVPLAMLERGIAGKIAVLEPRRLAARAAAERMSKILGETVGERVGYRMRGATKIGPDTRIEVITEGILARMLQEDPSLDGIGAVIFDEFHERSIHADLGLALAWDAREALRPDLKIVVMSATLNAAPVAALLNGAPVVRADGHLYPVETRWSDKPIPTGATWEQAVLETTQRAMADDVGGILVFLPGVGEINQIAGRLQGVLPAGYVLHRLFGMASSQDQRAALAVEKQRKVVLATAVAETSLTLPGIRCVVDAGRARRSRFDPARGMSRLVTERVSRAEADQRRGRAGREGPGIAYRLWTRAEESGLAPFAPPEIETADLAPLALELATWGSDASDLAFLTVPPEGPMKRARALLQQLGALDDSNRPTELGRTIAQYPLHPRLAKMLAVYGSNAAELAAILNDRDVLQYGAPVDIGLRRRALRKGGGWPADSAALGRVRDEAQRLAGLAPKGNSARTFGQMLAMAYPDRIAKRRAGNDARYVLSSGTGVRLAATDPLAGDQFLVVADAHGGSPDPNVRLAASISLEEIDESFAEDIFVEKRCHWSKRENRVIAVVEKRFGAIALSQKRWTDPPDADRSGALAEGLAILGLAALDFNDAINRFRARVAFARQSVPALPDLSNRGLMLTLDQWFHPNVGRAMSLAELTDRDWLSALQGMLTWDLRKSLDDVAPAYFETPLGRKVPLTYAPDGPHAEVRLQELFGLKTHPDLGQHSTPITLTILSPAGRPVQVTRDLPGFWANSYSDVRRDMRGRYPKHPWPENPADAEPTTRAKPRR